MDSFILMLVRVGYLDLYWHNLNHIYNVNEIALDIDKGFPWFYFTHMQIKNNQIILLFVLPTSVSVWYLSEHNIEYFICLQVCLQDDSNYNARGTNHELFLLDIPCWNRGQI